MRLRIDLLNYEFVLIDRCATKSRRRNRNFFPNCRSSEGGLDGGVDGSVQLAKDRVHDGRCVLGPLTSILGRRSREGRAGKQGQTHKLREKRVLNKCVDKINSNIMFLFLFGFILAVRLSIFPTENVRGLSRAFLFFLQSRLISE